MTRSLIAPALLLALAGCLPEVRIGAKDGVPQLTGSTEIPIECFVCGQPIKTGAADATTRKVEGGCEVSIIDDVQVPDQPDYARISDLTGFSGLLEAVELKYEAQPTLVLGGPL